jgi:L-aspartate oxidase
MIQIKEMMDRYVGLIRSEKQLAQAQEMVDDYSRMFEHGIHIINAESRNVTLVAKLVIQSARKRKESRGLHYMLEYPKKLRKFMSDTVIRRN